MERTNIYKMTQKGEISTVKIELGEDNKIIIWISYKQILTKKMISVHKSSKATKIYIHASTKNPSAIKIHLIAFQQGVKHD